MSSLPLRFLLLTVAGWMTREHHKAKLIVPMNHNAAVGGRVVRCRRRDGVLNFYHREAA